MSRVDWEELAETALHRIKAGGGEYGDIRFLHSTSQIVRGEDQRIAQLHDSQDVGFGVRVLYRGAWGFAASSVVSPEEVPLVADLAVEIAKGSATLTRETVSLSPEAVHADSI